MRGKKEQDVSGSEEITRQSDFLLETATAEAQTLLGKRDPNALLAVALANALGALTIEIRGLRFAQEAALDMAREAGAKSQAK